MRDRPQSTKEQDRSSSTRKRHPRRRRRSADTVPDDSALTFWTILTRTLARFRSDPWLAVPFLVAGGYVGFADVARTVDPIQATARGGHVGPEYGFSVYPSGLALTGRTFGSMVELRLPYLLWAVALELTAFLAVGIAGWAVLSRALGIARSRRTLATYLGVIVGFVLLLSVIRPRLPTFTGILPLDLALSLVSIFVAVRLFLVPVYLLAGDGPLESIAASNAGVRGVGLRVFGLVFLIAISTWRLGMIAPYGGFLSTALVAPLHAVAAVEIYEHQNATDGESDSTDDPATS